MYQKLLAVLFATVLTSPLAYATDKESDSRNNQGHKKGASIRDALDKKKLIGTWVDSRNYQPAADASEAELIQEPYSKYSLTFIQKNGSTECEGTAIYKPAGASLGSTRTGDLKGKVLSSHGAIPFQKQKADHFVVKNYNQKNTKDAIAIELIDNDTIEVTEFQGAQLGGLGVSFAGQYKRINAEAK